MKLKAKYLLLLTQLLVLLLLLLNIEYLNLVIQLKNDYNTKISKIEKKITDHDHDKYNTNPEFAENFTARLAQANLTSKNDITGLVKKQILIIN